MTAYETFRAAHVTGRPLILWNIWDAGSAAAVAAAGATALATGSASVAGAMGYPDGEAMPLELLMTLVQRIVATTALPLTVDFETGYADDPAALADNATALLAAGAIGCNIEDRDPAGGVRDVAAQVGRLRAIVRPGLFVNARTDLFLQAPAESHAGLVGDALERARAYADAGAEGFFAPGLVDADLIGQLCAASPLPVNILKFPAAPDLGRLASLGVARVSFGPFPWRGAMARLTEACRAETAA